MSITNTMCISYEKCSHSSGCYSFFLECCYCPLNPPRLPGHTQCSLILLFILPLPFFTPFLLLYLALLLPPSINLGTEETTTEELADTRHFTALSGSAKEGDLSISLSLQSQNLANHLFSPP